MTTLFDDTLIGREFGSRLLSVARFRQWLTANRREVVTNPDLDGFQFVQVEALLCALERGAIENLSHEVAASIPTATPMPDAKTADIASRWKVGADAHNQWRGLIQAAVQTGDLVLLHFGSKLPIEPAQQSIPSPKPVQRAAARDAELLDWLRSKGFDPKSLPKSPKGKPGLRAKARAHFAKAGSFWGGTTVFDKTWDRLRKSGDISEYD